MKVLEVEKLSYSYVNNKPILDNIDITLNKGDIVCLLGPNGSGKSTLIKQILFPTKKNKGCIKVYGKSIREMGIKEHSKIFSFVPQQIPVLGLTVCDTVLMGRNPYKKSVFLKPDSEDIRIVDEVLERVGLNDYKNRRLSSLSGGEMQRVIIAQALVKEAEIYFFDEPMSALDPESQRDFLKMATELSKSGNTVVFTTHNPSHALSLENVRIMIMDKNHKLTELDMLSKNDVKVIEQIFNDSMKICYHNDQKAFVSLFNYGTS